MLRSFYYLLTIGGIIHRRQKFLLLLVKPSLVFSPCIVVVKFSEVFHRQSSLVTCYALSIYSRSSVVKYFLENFLDFFCTANIVPKVFSLCPSDGGFAGKYVASKSLYDIDLRIPGVVFSVHPKILSVLVKRPG